MFLTHFDLTAHPFAEKPLIAWLQRDPRVDEANEKCTLLIIDEAHLIDPQTLTDLRLLISSIEDEIALKILFCGQENVRDILKRSSHADLVHRMPHRIALQALTKKQTGAYIDSRITQAGGTNKTFEPEAKDLIHDYTGGIPRQINNVATACLINAASRNIKKINEPLVNETMGEFHLP